MSSRVLWVVALVPLFACDPITAPQVSRTTILLSATPSGEFATGQGAWISDDGRHVAFFSTATNLVDDQAAPEMHVYVKNRSNGKVVLVTRNSDQGDVPVFCNPTGPLFISANGRFVVFLANLKPDNKANPPGGNPVNVFVRDLELNLTKRVIDPTIWPDTSVASACISEDGRFVVFATGSDNLGKGAMLYQQIYVSDLSTSPPTLTLVSHAQGAPATGANQTCSDCWISADGQTIAYLSNATNLDPGGDGDLNADVYLASFASGIVTDSIVVSRDSAGVKSGGSCSSPQLSPDGNFVVFVSTGNNMGVGSNGNVVLRNLLTNTTTCMTVTSDGLGPNSGFTEARVSRGGTRVAFLSKASNLTGNTSGIVQPYITVPGGGFEQVSVSDSGAKATLIGSGVSISSVGPWVVWTTASGNLVAPDPNGAEDVFARGPFRR